MGLDLFGLTNIMENTSQNKTRRTQLRVHFAQALQLGNLIQAEYTKSGLTDIAFAKYAEEKLGFKLSNATVSYQRKQLGLQSNREIAAIKNAANKISKYATRAEVEDLAERVRILEIFAKALQANRH